MIFSFALIAGLCSEKRSVLDSITSGPQSRTSFNLSGLSGKGFYLKFDSKFCHVKVVLDGE